MTLPCILRYEPDMTKLSHIDLNVSDYAKSLRFYDMILIPLGWKRLVCQPECSTYSDGTMKICMSPTEEKYLQPSFHRKRTGLNHLAFNASSKEEVDQFYQTVLLKNDVTCLYEKAPEGDPEYYAVFFEDPDRIKIEVVFAPGYCEPGHWTNGFESTFDPYK
jgi:catechol 2,3-dioxygenase-like lactoylglutathione lyase family enzyme